VSDGASDQDISRSLTQLKRYAETHFTEEEALMARIGYPDIEKHAKQHSSFINRLRSLDHKVGGAKEAAVMDMMGLLGSWWEGHIRNQDAKVAAYAKANRKRAA
jgi:hemerythrin-like metal-binding protein